MGHRLKTLVTGCFDIRDNHIYLSDTRVLFVKHKVVLSSTPVEYYYFFDEILTSKLNN